MSTDPVSCDPWQPSLTRSLLAPCRPQRATYLGLALLGAAVLLAGLLGVRSAWAATAEVTTVNNGGDNPYAYDPFTVTIAPGDSVTWINPSGTPLAPSQDHPTFCESGASKGECPWSSFDLPPGSEHTVTFPAEGTFVYGCLIHPYMNGATIVVGDGEPDPPPATEEPSPTPSEPATPSSSPTPEPSGEPTPDATPAPADSPGQQEPEDVDRGDAASQPADAEQEPDRGPDDDPNPAPEDSTAGRADTTPSTDTSGGDGAQDGEVSGELGSPTDAEPGQPDLGAVAADDGTGPDDGRSAGAVALMVAAALAVAGAAGLLARNWGSRGH